MANAGSEASITAAIVTHLMTAFLCSSGEVGPPSGLYPVPDKDQQCISINRPSFALPKFIAIRLACAYTTLFLSSLIL